MDKIDRIREMLKAQPDDSFLNFALAKEFEKGEKWNDALVQYQKLADRDPDYVGTYYHLGKLLIALDREEEALQTYRRGMQVAKAAGDDHSYRELVAAHIEIDDLEEEEG